MSLKLTEGKRISKKLDENLAFITEKLGVGVSFDVLIRQFKVGGKDVALVFVDGFGNGELITLIMQTLIATRREELCTRPYKKLFEERIPYMELSEVQQLDDLVKEVLAGPSALLIDGEDSAIILDTREYPVRQPEEPDIEKLTRGSRDGFVETLLFNVTLVRRRLRDPGFRAEVMQVGQRSKTDIAILYINDVVDPGLLKTVKSRIENIKVDGLPMAEKSVEEFIVEGKYNIFPQVRYTERPDVAAIHILEGHVVIIVDTSPSAMIAPATFFHHVQHAEEYRQSIPSGVYVRWIRFMGLFLSLFISPIWLLFSLEPQLLPQSLAFIGPEDPGLIPLTLQFIIAHLGIDLIRMATIHTPSPITVALGFIGAILVGDIAVQVGIFAPEIILYSAIVAIGMFSTPSWELSLAFRLIHLFLLLSTGFLKLPGLIGGTLIVFVLMALTKSFKTPYMWPLVPFNGSAMLDILFRRPVSLAGLRPEILKTGDSDRLPSDSKEDEPK
ncbi:spore germination protein [Candidatus Contubernalis alkaliaceticus]|uniref:spore germination protein n=1 Tax=Candidatus Contubernalis alkaliaceticus TaxID=338645 RepID=UPI001F4C51E6|nr:spore germination protein [Candidatus Contubernalis alkalaceticus]UNC92516.1 spore germination protein [Candidatus Contubernalis alkalaceticus]